MRRLRAIFTLIFSGKGFFLYTSVSPTEGFIVHNDLTLTDAATITKTVQGLIDVTIQEEINVQEVKRILDNA